MGVILGRDGEYFGSEWGVFWVRMELWDEMAEWGDGRRAKDR